MHAAGRTKSTVRRRVRERSASRVLAYRENLGLAAARAPPGVCACLNRAVHTGRRGHKSGASPTPPVGAGGGAHRIQCQHAKSRRYPRNKVQKSSWRKDGRRVKTGQSPPPKPPCPARLPNNRRRTHTHGRRRLLPSSPGGLCSFLDLKNQEYRSEFPRVKDKASSRVDRQNVSLSSTQTPCHPHTSHKVV